MRNEVINTLLALGVINPERERDSNVAEVDLEFIKKEYELIKLKKSTLSKRERARVVYQFEQEMGQ
jgi:hypothetical protein